MRIQITNPEALGSLTLNELRDEFYKEVSDITPLVQMMVAVQKTNPFGYTEEQWAATCLGYLMFFLMKNSMVVHDDPGGNKS